MRAALHRTDTNLETDRNAEVCQDINFAFRLEQWLEDWLEADLRSLPCLEIITELCVRDGSISSNKGSSGSIKCEISLCIDGHEWSNSEHADSEWGNRNIEEVDIELLRSQKLCIDANT